MPHTRSLNGNNHTYYLHSASPKSDRKHETFDSRIILRFDHFQNASSHPSNLRLLLNSRQSIRHHAIVGIQVSSSLKQRNEDARSHRSVKRIFANANESDTKRCRDRRHKRNPFFETQNFYLRSSRRTTIFDVALVGDTKSERTR